METCPECGNTALQVRSAGSARIHECGLCGAQFGDHAALTELADRAAAAQRGVAWPIWPLVRVLEALPGLAVRDSQAGGLQPPTLPFVELGGADARVLVQLENLAKSLQLGAGGLRCHWVVEVEYRRHLAFVLKPRHGGGPVAVEHARDAQHDLDRLRRNLERDVRLGWWRHAAAGSDR